MRAICPVARRPARPRILALLAGATLIVGAQVPALAQRADQTAMSVPRPALAGGIAGFPQPLAPSDAARLRRVFDLQARGDITAAAREAERLEDRRLLGHVLADRWGRGYEPQPAELVTWLTDNPDHPDAPSIHAMLVRRAPRGTPLPAAPRADALSEHAEVVPEESEPPARRITRVAALDRAVRFLAVALPAAIGVVVAFMLITPLSPRGEVSFLLDRNRVAIAPDRLRVDDAMYRGQDSRGRPFSLVAGEAVQRSNSVPVVALSDLTARIVLPEGPAELTALQGQYDIEAEQVAIPGIVRFTAADGYRIAARNVAIDLNRRVLAGRGQVSGVIPAGTFSANAMRADLAARTLVLEGDARFTMIPGRLQMPELMQ